MKKNIVFFIPCVLCAFFFSTISLISSPPVKQLKGIIEIPGNLSTPEFAIHFDGKQIFNKDDGFFVFILDENPQKLSLLICDDFNPHIKRKRTVSTFEIEKQEQKKYFVLTIDENEQPHWNEIELASELIQTTTSKASKTHDTTKTTGKISIPDDCIIVLMDPNLVETVKPWLVNADGELPGPKIVLKKNKIEEIRRSSSKSLMKALDIARFFEMHKTEDQWKQPGVKISC